MFNWLKFSMTKAHQNNTTTSGTIEDLKLYGPNSAGGTAVNPTTAMQQATVFSCIRVLSDTVAQMPCRLKTTDSETKLTANDTGNPLFNVLRWSPCPWMTAYDYHKFNVTCMNLYGYHISKVIRNVTGKIMELLPINPEFISSIAKGKDGRLQFKMNMELRQNGLKVADKTVTLEGGKDAFYTYYATTDGVTPISPIGQNKASIGLAITAASHGASMFKNDATPPLVVEMPQALTPEQAKRFVDTWKATGTGMNYGLPRILESGAKVTKLQMSNQDAQYLETRQFQTDEIAGIFGVPPHMVGSKVQAKGWSTMEQLMSEFITLSINPWTVRLEQSINKHLIPRPKWGVTSAKYATNTLLRGDTAARATFYRELFGMGGINSNEIRELEDLNPRTDENGDQFYISANLKTPEQLEAEGQQSQRDLGLEERLQKIYLSVGSVISTEEARDIINRSGGNLSEALPSSLEKNDGE